MIKYWPNQRSINLNNITVDLFFSIENKLKYNLSNCTNFYLHIDILNNLNKRKIFSIILNELRQLILELIELNLTHNNLRALKQKILMIFMDRVYYRFSLVTHKFDKDNKELLRIENDTFIEELLTYLLFGSSYINQDTFLFDSMYTPYYHVQILFENFIITISNITIERLILKLRSYTQINYFLNKRKICNRSYLSNRSIALFINNLKWQRILSLYLYEPKSLYNERQQIWIIGKQGISTKYIYTKKIEKLKKLSQFRILLLLWLEVKDIIIPKIEKFLIQIGKYIIYFSINLLSNIILISIRIIIFYIIKSNKTLR
uniref:Ycf55 n=1 Tax=Osmundaria fimbriata TaxID=228265 RepID=A0A1Z1M3Y4_OSMFI|nr:hypothetical protein [Osmundaria fimbriata]ARW60736.1 hypothetical protein [Osmundaria fimbriata]